MKFWKKNTWNIRLLVDDSFVPLSKQPSLIYCRLTDFKKSRERSLGQTPFTMITKITKTANPKNKWFLPKKVLKIFKNTYTGGPRISWFHNSWSSQIHDFFSGINFMNSSQIHDFEIENSQKKNFFRNFFEIFSKFL